MAHSYPLGQRSRRQDEGRIFPARDVGFSDTYVKALLGPDSMVVGIK
jgi:hypothetical protein